MQLKDKTLQNLHEVYGNLKIMKINELLNEAELDQLLKQASTVAPTKTSSKPNSKKGRDARGRYSSQQPGAVTGAINKVASAIANAPGKSYGSSFIQPDKVQTSAAGPDFSTTAGPDFSTTAEPVVQPGVVAPENAKYIRAVAQNKVTSQGTGTAEIDAMLRSAGILKP
jgi:hypothetical protein